jgi:hypothetical protein
MTSPDEVVFLFDVHNTLLDNDRVQDDLRRHLERESGPESWDRYWAIFEQLKNQGIELRAHRAAVLSRGFSGSIVHALFEFDLRLAWASDILGSLIKNSYHVGNLFSERAEKFNVQGISAIVPGCAAFGV